MSDAKIEIRIGQIQFSGQGEQDWVAKQLDKILAQAERLVHLAPFEDTADGGRDGDGRQRPTGDDPGIGKKTLPVFLSEKGATKNQVKKFLATAIWLQAKGQSRLQTRDVANALKTSNQTRIGNPSDALNKNVSKGYCEKDGNQFFVTDEGRNAL